MNKRILSLFICIAMLFALPAPGFADEGESIVYDEAKVDVIVGIGLIPENAALNDKVTRGAFADILYKIFVDEDAIARSNWKDEYLKTLDDSEFDFIENFGVGNERFTDVGITHDYYDAINYVVSLGLMNGVSATEFNPDAYITYEQMNKVFSCLLGYEWKANLQGGYPAGYNAVASSLKFYSGMQTGPLTSTPAMANIAEVLYNMLDVKVMTEDTITDDSVGYTTSEDETFLTTVLGMGMLEGILEDNGVTSLTGASDIEKNQIAVGGKILETTDSSVIRGDLIATEVVAYYTYNDAGKGSLLYMCADGNDTIYEFTAEDFGSASADSISFYVNGKEKALSVKGDVAYIYNGLASTVYKPSVLNAVNSGVIRLICNGTSVRGIVVDDYRSAYVTGINSDNKNVYFVTADKLLSAANVICLDDEDDDLFVTVYDEDGNRADFGAVSTGVVLDIAQNGSVIKVRISKDKLSGFAVSEIATGDTGLKISNGSQTLSFVMGFEDTAMHKDIMPGESYNIYLNTQGKACYVEKLVASDKTVVYCISFGRSQNGFSSSYQVKYYGTDGIIYIKNLADKISLRKQDLSESYSEPENLYDTYLSGYKGLMSVKLNSDDEVSIVELPASSQEVAGDENTLQIIKVIDENNASTEGYVTQTSGWGMIGEKFILTGDTVCITYNPYAANEDNAYNLADWKQLLKADGYTTGGDGRNNVDVLTAYTTKANTKTAEYIVCQTASASSAISSENFGFAIVKKAYTSADDEGTHLTLDVYSVPSSGTAGDKKLYVTEEAWNNVYDEPSYGASGVKNPATAEKYTIQPGDIIRYASDSSGEVTQIRMVWDENGINEHDGTRGTLAGTIDYYTDTANDGRTNPYIKGSDNELVTTDAILPNKGQLKVLYGSVVSTNGYEVICTTKNLTSGLVDLDSDNTGYADFMYWQNGGTVVELDGRNVKVYNGKNTDIKSYREVYTDCTRVIAFTRLGWPQKVIYINGKLDR